MLKVMRKFLGSRSDSEDSYLLERDTKSLDELLSTCRGNSLPSTWVKPFFLECMSFENADAKFLRNVGHKSSNDTASNRWRLESPCIKFTKRVTECKNSKFDYRVRCTVELQVSGLIGTANYPNMQKILIIEFFFENGLHWLFEVRLLPFAVCTCL